ncbi:MAG: right-handed parallel beta-helix repeat-containing protein [Bryobacteraceae bacterium]
MKSKVLIGVLAVAATFPIKEMMPLFGQTREELPTLEVSATDLSFSVARAHDPALQVVTVRAKNDGAVSWTASRSQPWLTLLPASGTSPGKLSIAAVTTDLKAGTYTDTVMISTGGASPSTVRVKVTLRVGSAAGGQHYVSASGSAGADGSINHPWDLVTALAHPGSVRPGDTIWLRGGTYGNGRDIFRSRLLGSAEAPVIVRPYPGERAIINGWLQVGCCDRDPHPDAGAYVWFWDLEFASSVADRTGQPAGPPGWGESQVLDSADTWAPGSKFINNTIHDTRMGISMWKEALDAEAYGNVIYNNGFQASDRGHGHGFYIQNDNGTKYVTDNIIFNQFDNGIQAYGSDQAFVRNILLEGNIAFNNGVIASGRGEGPRADNIVFAGGGGVRGIRLLSNYFFHTPQTNLGYNELGWNGENRDIVAENNDFMGGFEAVAVGNWQSVTFQNNRVYSHGKYNLMLSTSNSTSGYAWNNNTYYGSGLFTFNGSGATFDGWQAKSHLDRNSSFRTGDPKGIWTIVRPNLYEQGRANIVVYNWDLASFVTVDVSGVLTRGRQFQVRDAQNFFGPAIVRGTFDGSLIRIPMSGLQVAAPHGNVPNPAHHTAPQFGAFVLLPAD